MDKPPIEDEEIGKGEEEENEIEVNVQISNSADTLQNRFSVVILDVKDKNERVPNEGTPMKGAPQDNSIREINYEDVENELQQEASAQNGKDENFDEILLEERHDGEEHANGGKTSQMKKRKGRNSEDELEMWRKGIRLSLLTFVYVNFSILGCINVFFVLINILVGLSLKTETIRPARILITFIIMFVIFATVWAVFQLRQTLHREWFVRSLWAMWISSVSSTLYVVVSIAMTTSSASTGFTVFLFCCIAGSACLLSITSVIAAIHLSANALIDCPTSTCSSFVPSLGKVKRHDNAWHTKGNNGNVEGASSWDKAFNFRTAYRCSVALFVISCFSIPVEGAIAIFPCSVYRFFTFSFIILIIPSIITGIVNHVQEKKSKVLWLAFLWMSAFGLLITIVRIVVIIIQIARPRSCEEGYSVTWYYVLYVSLLVLVLLKFICLVLMTKTAVGPLRNQGNREEATVT